MTESTTKQRCPHCRHALPPVRAANGPDPDATPEPGGVSVCPYCAETAVFDENIKLRKATETELEEFELDEDYRIIRTQARRQATEHFRTRSHPEGETEEGDEESGIYAIPLLIGADGEIEIEGMPTRLRDLITPVLNNLRARMLGEQIREHVTEEVANHVLAIYGNERASYPSVTTGALISLVRLCKDSDDHLLSLLMDTEGIRGYVLAVTMLAENPPEGIEMLEMLAGLRDPQDGSTK